jgi:hypothetical protein
VATGALLDPIRLFWLASLSVQKHPGRFLRLVGALSREFFQKIRYPRKIATGYRAAAIR